MSAGVLLIGDIGGTNARFALVRPDEPGFFHQRSFDCAAHGDAMAVIRRYLVEAGVDAPAVICLAAAGPVVEQRVELTNNPWILSARDLGCEFEAAEIRLLNDFEAVACGLPALARDDCRQIGPPGFTDLDRRAFRVGVMGPGTGLGAAGLIGHAGDLIPIIGEAGHVGFAPEDGLQTEILAVMRQRFERVSAERLLSGTGLQNLYRALAEIHGESTDSPGPEQIFATAEVGPGSLAAVAVDQFFTILGQVAGDFALSLGAVDGIYLGGGMLPRQVDLLLASEFRHGFESKGRHRRLMEVIPTHLITHPFPGLLGAEQCARLLFQGPDYKE